MRKTINKLNWPAIAMYTLLLYGPTMQKLVCKERTAGGQVSRADRQGQGQASPGGKEESRKNRSLDGVKTSIWGFLYSGCFLPQFRLYYMSLDNKRSLQKQQFIQYRKQGVLLI